MASRIDPHSTLIVLNNYPGKYTADFEMFDPASSPVINRIPLNPSEDPGPEVIVNKGDVFVFDNYPGQYLVAAYSNDPANAYLDVTPA